MPAVGGYRLYLVQTHHYMPAGKQLLPVVSLLLIPYLLYHKDNKFNTVLYGVQECPSGMSKSARFESDLSSVVSILSSLDGSINSQSIKTASG